MELLAQALNLIMQPCYQLTGNWWLAILLFTVIVKVVLLPMSLWCQKNSIVMVQLMPDLNRLKVKYFGDRETIGDKQNQLYKQRKYHPLLSLVPLAVQIVILFGLVDVIHGVTDHGAPGTELLGMVPVEDGGISWLMPLLAGLSAIVMGFAQNRINPLQKAQTRAEKNMTNGLSIALSFALGIFVAMGMGFYWVCSNLTSIAIQALCNIIIKPANYIDYADLEESRAQLEELEALGASDRKWWQRDPNAKREKADYKRFFNVVGKHLVFYSEGSGFYKYFQGIIEWLLANSDVTIHYVTNDPDDQVFGIAEGQPRIRPYYIGPKRIITLMMKMDADMVVATLEDLDTYYIKRSYVRDDVEYVFAFHHMTSAHLTPSLTAFAGYDAALCVGPHQIEELRRIEERYGHRRKTLVPCGYDLLDRATEGYAKLMERRAAEGADEGRRPTVLIGPSWQEGCIPDSCIDDMLGALLGRGWRIIVRPHPEYVKRYRARWEAILARYADATEDELLFERDFSSNETVFASDILITDWSTVAFEFAFSTHKPCVFIDTPMKVGNPKWEELGIPPTDITLRDKVGVSLDPSDMGRLADVVAEMLANQGAWRDRIAQVTCETVFNLGSGAEAAGQWVLARLLELQARRKGADGGSAAPAASGGDRASCASGRKSADSGPALRKSVEAGGAACAKGGKRACAGAAARTAAPHLRRAARGAASWAPEALVATAIAFPFLAQPAYAYVDPSVMTYTIQALAGVAVALSAVAGVAFRKTRKKLFALLKIDENARKEVEPDIHRVVDGLIVPNAGEDADARAAAQAAATSASVPGAAAGGAGERRGRGGRKGVGAHPEERLRWRARFGFAAAASAFLSFTLLVVAPFELVAANADSLLLDVGSIWWCMALLAAAVAAVLALSLSALRGRAFTAGFSAVLAAGVCFYLQALFMNQGLPTADGNAVSWRDFAPIAFGTGAVWLAVIVAAVVGSRFRPRLWRVGGVAVALVLALVQGVGVASLVANPQTLDSARTRVDLTEEGLFDLSPKGNVVVFVLDTFDTAYMDQVLQDYPDALDAFEGFTYFRNCTGSMIPTRYAVPSLLTGQSVASLGSYDEYFHNAYAHGTFLSDIADEGYTVGIYSDSTGMNDEDPAVRQQIVDQTLNVRHIDIPVDPLGTMGILAQCALYRDAPWLLKPWFWYYTDELNNAMVADTVPLDAEGNLVSADAAGDAASTVYRMDDAGYLEKLRDRGLALDDAGAAGAFRFIHLTGAHYPYVLDENADYVGDGNSSLVQQARGSLEIVAEYLDQMKELGVYDSSTIIVTADHGNWYLTEDIDAPSTPLMLAKPARAEGALQAGSSSADGPAQAAPVAVSEEPVSHYDLQATVVEAMGGDPSAYGSTLFDEHDPLEPRYYLMTAVQPDGTYVAYKEYEIVGDALDFDNWRLTGREWEIPED